MRAIQTDLLTPGNLPASQTERDHIYNGLDAMVTLEVLEALLPQLDNQTAATYSFERELQGPILDMNTHGVLVDQHARQTAINAYTLELAQITKQFDYLMHEAFDFTINWNSPPQLMKFFYEFMGLPVIKHKSKPTVNRDALEKLAFNYMLAEPIINHILAARDIGKKLGVLKTGIDSDGRIRTSYNIAGTNTGRLSSSLSEFSASGGNLQNVEELLRAIFVADAGKKLGYIDLEQAESRAVGAILWNLFHDGTYLDACESGDLHTYVCRLTNQEIKWTGDIKLDKELAEQPYYRQHSFRHMNKVLGHGTNYGGKPWTMQKHTKIDASIIKEFQQKYFAAFPMIPEWHKSVAQTLMDDGYLISLTGRRRWFFGRRNEDETIRGAIAFDPQGSVADLLNRGMINVWHSHCCDLLMQVHDAILIQYPEEQEDEIIPQVLELIKVPLELRYGRTLVIPSEAKSGWNWSNWSPTNPDGIKKYKGADRRVRTPPTSLLAQLVR